MTHSNQEALKRYNDLFDNTQYQAAAYSLAEDLNVERESQRVSDGMNLITNVALSLCGYAGYGDAWLMLAVFCYRNGVSRKTAARISRCLRIFQQPGDTSVEDFEHTVQTLLQADETRQRVQEAVSAASGIHSWRGRAAYHLLAAADYLVQAAVQLLLGRASDVHEKLQHALSRILSALREGLAHSEEPAQFDFSAQVFPAQED